MPATASSARSKLAYMNSVLYAVRAGIYIVCFALSFYAMGALDFSRFLKQGHVLQAQILYWLLVMSLTYLSGSFVTALIQLR